MVLTRSSVKDGSSTSQLRGKPLLNSFLSTQNEAPPLPSPKRLRAGRHRAGLPGNVDIITGSALTPLRESVTALPAPAYRQEGGASSRLARDHGLFSARQKCPDLLGGVELVGDGGSCR